MSYERYAKCGCLRGAHASNFICDELKSRYEAAYGDLVPLRMMRAVPQQTVTPGMWCDAVVAKLKARVVELEATTRRDCATMDTMAALIADLESERAAAYRTIAELSRRPMVERLAELEAEIARLKADPSPPNNVSRETLPARALRYSV